MDMPNIIITNSVNATGEQVQQEKCSTFAFLFYLLEQVMTHQLTQMSMILSQQKIKFLLLVHLVPV